ncbi:hypothetical protein PVK06_017112 [Gossypium arboreum]|uniref:Uncharacterized protein n=1 Tax=Gossypium arboreum TaxID=29729 RepID=A0ABR0Q1U7_GOSAR|nr:hypothetical protein PVK06_017112 [Gossypium arboreum]
MCGLTKTASSSNVRAKQDCELTTVLAHQIYEATKSEIVNAEIEPEALQANPALAQMRQHSKECAKKHKAISCLQNGVSDMTFIRILDCVTPKQAWDKFKEEF